MRVLIRTMKKISKMVGGAGAKLCNRSRSVKLPNLDKAQPRRSGAELTYVKSWVRVTVPRRRSNHWDLCPTRRARWGCWSGYCFLRHPAS